MKVKSKKTFGVSEESRQIVAASLTPTAGKLPESDLHSCQAVRPGPGKPLFPPIPVVGQGWTRLQGDAAYL